MAVMNHTPPIPGAGCGVAPAPGSREEIMTTNQASLSQSPRLRRSPLFWLTQLACLGLLLAGPIGRLVGARVAVTIALVAGVQLALYVELYILRLVLRRRRRRTADR